MASYAVGIIGAGGIASAHVEAIRQIEQAVIVAICDISLNRAEEFASEAGVSNYYATIADMVSEHIFDLVIICTWGVTHSKIGIELAKSKRVRAILCEKPFTQTAEQARELVSCTNNEGVLVAEAFKFRHHPMHIEAHRLISSGAIGKVLGVRSTFCTNVDLANRRPELNWRFNEEQGGGSIYDLACYNIHHARFIFGREPLHVFSSKVSGIEVDDAASIMLIFDGGRTAQISVGFDAWASQYAEISGDQGIIFMDQAWNNENCAVQLILRNNGGEKRFEYPPQFQFVSQLNHMFSCIEGKCSHRIPAEHSEKQMWIMDAVKKSMDTGKVISL